jgi:DOPA 4,5-dioxygenase
MTEATSYHAHVYFDAATIEKAKKICLACSQKFGVTMGRVHERPVGPHPDWSCQLAFGPEKLGDVVGWLALNRDGLVVLVHPETGDAVKDHSEHAVWMGAIRPLDLSVLKRP